MRDFKGVREGRVRNEREGGREGGRERAGGRAGGGAGRGESPFPRQRHTAASWMDRHMDHGQLTCRAQRQTAGADSRNSGGTERLTGGRIGCV